jgi:peptidylprolyl isomerase
MRKALVPFLVAGGIVLAACGSSPTTTASDKTTTTSSTTTTTSSGTTTTTSSGTTTTGGASSSSSVPAVGNAADLSKEPTISAGTPPPPTTLQTKDLVVGTGKTATAQSTVTVAYVGANYADGKVFDASWTDGSGAPVSFSLAGGVIPGFAQGIAGMKEGGRRVIVMPPDLGYGAGGNGPVGPNETLTFVVDLKKVS